MRAPSCRGAIHRARLGFPPTNQHLPIKFVVGVKDEVLQQQRSCLVEENYSHAGGFNGSRRLIIS